MLTAGLSGRFLGARHAILGPRLFFPFFCRPFFSLGWLAGWFSFMPGCLASGGHSLPILVMGYESFDVMVQRYKEAKASGDNVDDPKVYYSAPLRPPK